MKIIYSIILYIFFFTLPPLASQNFEYTTPATPFDLNGDGKCELIIFSSDSRMRVYDSDKTELYSANTNGSVQSLPAIFDINLDGRLEIIFITITGYLQVLDVQTGRSVKGFENIRIPSYNNIPPVIADIDADNEPEIIAAGAQIYAFKNNGQLKEGYPVNIFSAVEKPMFVYKNSDRKNHIYIFTQDKRVLLLKNNSITNITQMYYTIDYNNNSYLTEINNSIELLGSNFKTYSLFSYGTNNTYKNLLTMQPSGYTHLNVIYGINSIDDSNAYRLIYFDNSVYPAKYINELAIPKNGGAAYYRAPLTDGIMFQAEPASLKKSHFNFPYIDYTNNGLLDLALPEYKQAIRFIGYNNSINDSLQITDSIDLPDREIIGISLGDMTGGGKGSIIFNDTANIEIFNTESVKGASPLLLADNLNSNNHYNIAPPVISSSTAAITIGSSYYISWRKPFFFDTYEYSYSFDNINYSEFSSDTELYLTNLSDKKYEFYIKARNQKSIEPLFISKLKFAIDNLPPSVYFIQPQNNEYVSGIWNIQCYAFDSNIDTVSIYYKTAEASDYILINSANSNIDTGNIYSFNTDNINSDTIYLKISAFEINSNNYSETEIVIYKTKTGKMVDYSEYSKLTMSGVAAELEIFRNSLSYSQYVKLNFAQINNSGLKIRSPIIHLDFTESHFKMPAILKIKFNENYNLPTNSASKKTPSYSNNTDSLKIFYTADKMNYVKFNPAFDADFFKLPVYNAGYYFIAEDTEQINESMQDSPARFLIHPRIIRQNENALIEFNQNLATTADLTVYNMNGRLIEKIISGASVNAGGSLINHNFSSKKYDTGLYIANFKCGSINEKYIFYIK